MKLLEKENLKKCRSLVGWGWREVCRLIAKDMRRLCEVMKSFKLVGSNGCTIGYIY